MVIRPTMIVNDSSGSDGKGMLVKSVMNPQDPQSAATCGCSA